jgi:hypothetical protein
MPRIASCILCSPVEQLDVDDHGTSLGRRCVFCGGAALALALLSPAALAEKEDPTRSKRPQTGDLFAFFAGDHAGQVIKPADLKAGGPPVLAWPMEPKSKVLRDGSRFNQVLPIRRGKVPNYTPVTKQRLENPEPGNWLLYRRTYDGHGFSPLKQINTTNVKNLVPVWTFSTGVVEGHEAPPMVNNGVRRQSGATSTGCRRTYSSCTRPAAASRYGRTSCSSQRRTTISSRSMPRPARSCGTPRCRTTRRAST